MRWLHSNARPTPATTAAIMKFLSAGSSHCELAHIRSSRRSSFSAADIAISTTAFATLRHMTWLFSKDGSERCRDGWYRPPLLASGIIRFNAGHCDPRPAVLGCPHPDPSGSKSSRSALMLEGTDKTH